jgi:hypothetical protein
MLAALLPALIGCAPLAPPAGEDAAMDRSDGRICDANQAQALVGRPGTREIAVEAQRLSGAGAVRWLQPGQLVTMEYRADRLNIEVDAQNRIVAIRCG